MELSPLAPRDIVKLPEVEGVKFSAVKAGIKYQDRLDLALIKFDPGSVMAGVFTNSLTRSIAVLNSQRHIGSEGDDGIAILINSGNSNAFTGQRGETAMNECIAALSSALDLKSAAIHMASTGVIGEPLPSAPILISMNTLVSALKPSGANDAAEAIMTTDTFAKTAFHEIEIDGTQITISGFAKGSGMIAPDMATMLGFLVTDAAIDQNLLQKALTKATSTSFNAITVDSDTSTSDSVYLGATQKARISPIKDEKDPRFGIFCAGLSAIMTNLAQQIVKDGEGASKFVEVHISGAQNHEAAKRVAMAVANSPLVKTAIAGEDPNWGRIIMAVGKSGEAAERDLLKVWIGDQLVADNGMVHSEYSEAQAAKYMQNENIRIAVDLGIGNGAFTAWTCDLTKKYIEINADYRS